MKKLIFTLAVFLLGFFHVHAQNPYATLGIEEQVLHYDDTHEEVFGDDTLKTIGYAIYNRINGLTSLFDLSDSLVAILKIDPSKMARFLSVDPITKQYPELTPYQFASNTPLQAIDLDGLEAWVVYRDYFESENQPIIKMVFDKDLQKIGGVYEASRYFDNSGFITSVRWGSANYSDYPNEFPNNGNYWRKDGKSKYTVDTEGGVTYGHAAAELKFGGKGVGFNFQFGNYLLGGNYNSSTGGNAVVLKTDQMNIVGELGAAGVSIGGGATLSPNEGEFSNANFGAGFWPFTKSLAPTNTSIISSNSSESQFIGLELNAAFGIGGRLKLGGSYNPQPNLTDYEKTEKNSLDNKAQSTSETPNITKYDRP